jgi:hypothetical protein
MCFAMEAAVLSSVAHPSIVQLYSCLNNMVELPRSSGTADGERAAFDRALTAVDCCCCWASLSAVYPTALQRSM